MTSMQRWARALYRSHKDLVSEDNSRTVPVGFHRRVRDQPWERVARARVCTFGTGHLLSLGRS
jgi:hypothetical protein